VKGEAAVALAPEYEVVAAGTRWPSTSTSRVSRALAAWNWRFS